MSFYIYVHMYNHHVIQDVEHCYCLEGSSCFFIPNPIDFPLR